MSTYLGEEVVLAEENSDDLEEQKQQMKQEAVKVLLVTRCAACFLPLHSG